jgi:hypothetical protein
MSNKILAQERITFSCPYSVHRIQNTSHKLWWRYSSTGCINRTDTIYNGSDDEEGYSRDYLLTYLHTELRPS